MGMPWYACPRGRGSEGCGVASVCSRVSGTVVILVVWSVLVAEPEIDDDDDAMVLGPSLAPVEVSMRESNEKIPISLHLLYDVVV